MKSVSFKKLKNAWLASTAAFLVSGSVSVQDASTDQRPVLQVLRDHPQEAPPISEEFRQNPFENWDESLEPVFPTPTFPRPTVENLRKFQKSQSASESERDDGPPGPHK